jgi:hypothetical protein
MCNLSLLPDLWAGFNVNFFEKNTRGFISEIVVFRLVCR